MIEAIAMILLSIASSGDSIPSSDDQLVESLWQCREIEDDLTRLECFDVAFMADEVIDDEMAHDQGTDDQGTDDQND